MAIRCEVVSQDRMVWEGDADIVIVPGTFGQMGILPNHAPLLSTLDFGILTVRNQDGEEHFTVAGGIVEVQPDIITVLADAAENVAEINVARAEAARKRAQEFLEKGPPPDTDAYLAMEAALRRSNLRLEAAQRFRRAGRSMPVPGIEQGELDSLMALFSKELGIDLGTLFIRVAEGNQIILEEPTVAAIVIEEQKMVAWGQEAQNMLGKVPESLEVTRPLINGVIADYEVTEYMLAALLRRIGSPVRFFRPSIMVTVPFGVTSVESRAVHEAALQAGSREAFLVQQPLAAALGVDLPIGTPSGNMLICMGGGATQAAVMAMYGIVAADTLRAGGISLDEAIVSYVRKKYGLIIGQLTAEQVKLRIGAAVPQDEEESVEIQGQDQVSGLPRPATLTTGEVVEALRSPLGDIIETARRVLEKTPPELVSDIIDRGVALTGGGALLRGIDKLMTKELGVPAYLVDNPTTCTAEGAVRALNMFPIIKRNLPQV